MVLSRQVDGKNDLVRVRAYGSEELHIARSDELQEGAPFMRK